MLISLNFKRKSRSEESDTDPKPPFRARLHAWWNGYYLPPVTEAGSVAPEGDGAEDRSGKPVAALQADVPSQPAEATTPWPAPRRKLSELVWGRGYTGPGGDQLYTELAQPMGLDSSCSVIEIGSGLGGGTRLIAGQFGAYVTGWDLEPELAEEASEQAAVHSLDKKASVYHLDMDNFAFKENFYNGALICDTLYRVENKEELVQATLDSLKVGSQLVIWDLFYDENGAGPALEEWTHSESAPVFPWPIDAARTFLTDHHIDIRVTSDDTEKYCAMAQKAWSDMVANISREPIDEELVIPMVREVERWTRRVAAMESGDLRLYKLSGIKRKPVE